MRRSPVRERASINRIRSATGTGASFWSPSRGPTSRISTRAGHSVIGTGYDWRHMRLRPSALDRPLAHRAPTGPKELPPAPVSLVPDAHPQLHGRGPEVERLAHFPLEVAEVLLRQRPGREQRERRWVARTLRRVN